MFTIPLSHLGARGLSSPYGLNVQCVFPILSPNTNPVSKHADRLLCPVRAYGIDACARREGKVLPQTGGKNPR